MGQCTDVSIMDETDAAEDDEVVGNGSMWTPSVFTIKLQKGNDWLGGKFLAIVTCLNENEANIK